jgi:uncharacterized cupin superfamily protein
MTTIVVLKIEGDGAPVPEREKPAADKLLAGDHQTVTYNQWTGENGRLYCGTWEGTPGKVKVEYTEWEFCHLIDGEVVLTNMEGRCWRLKAGDGFIVPPGFKGTWETVRPARKHYVILAAKEQLSA